MFNISISRVKVTLSIVLLILVYQFVGSCANTSTPPMGGPKDTIPPKLLAVVPDSGVLNFPISGGRITLVFDEYIALKETQKNIFLSPPQTKALETKIRGKSIVTSFPYALDSNQTYTINFGNSIEDNNEGNKFHRYSYPFTTGAELDTMMVSGNVSHAATLLPASGVTVALYRDLSDSALYKNLPSAITKTDEFGYFIVRNIKSEPYAIYAFGDDNFNYKYDPENEQIAFLDSSFIPYSSLSKESPELLDIGPKDTLLAMSRPAHIELYLFKEENIKQFIVESKRVQNRMGYIKFSASNPDVISLTVNNYDSNSLKIEQNIKRDSVVVWITDTTLAIPDTMRIGVEYMKTDSIGELSPNLEWFNLLRPKTTASQSTTIPSTLGQGLDKEKRKDLLEFNIEVDPALVEQHGFKLLFEAPISIIKKELITLTSKNPRGDINSLNYTIKGDSLWSRIMEVKTDTKLLPGYEYSLEIAQNAFKDIYSRTNDSIIKSVTLPKNEKLSKLSLDISGAEGNYIVELTNITRDRVYRSFRIDRDTILEFPYLQKGKYSVKITEDINGNGITDTGILTLRKQPEKVRLYALPDGNTIINIPESFEFLQSVNLKEIFNPKNDEQ